MKLWNEIKHHQVDRFATDYWKVYPKIIPKRKHVQTKKETFTVEGYNRACLKF